MTENHAAPTAPTPPPGRNLLADQGVVITAAAGTGIGSALAERCQLEGARLVISDLHERRLDETADRLAELGDRPTTILCNVTDEAQVQNLVAGSIEALGGIDVWMNNAGLGGNAPIVDMTDEQWSVVLDVTLTGTFRCLRAVLPHMYERGRGAIVNNASVLGWRAQELQAHYAAAKAGVMALTRSAAMEAAEHGVRINAVSPSIAIHAFLKKSASEELLAELASREAFGRGAEPWEVANVMVFLASDYSSYMTGEVVSVSSQRA